MVTAGTLFGLWSRFVSHQFHRVKDIPMIHSIRARPASNPSASWMNSRSGLPTKLSKRHNMPKRMSGRHRCPAQLSQLDEGSARFARCDLGRFAGLQNLRGARIQYRGELPPPPHDRFTFVCREPPLSHKDVANCPATAFELRSDSLVDSWFVALVNSFGRPGTEWPCRLRVLLATRAPARR